MHSYRVFLRSIGWWLIVSDLSHSEMSTNKCRLRRVC